LSKVEPFEFNVQVVSRFCMLDGRKDIQEGKNDVLRLLCENKKLTMCLYRDHATYREHYNSQDQPDCLTYQKKNLLSRVPSGVRIGHGKGEKRSLDVFSSAVSEPSLVEGNLSVSISEHSVSQCRQCDTS
jgi:hypothetical protein